MLLFVILKVFTVMKIHVMVFWFLVPYNDVVEYDRVKMEAAWPSVMLVSYTSLHGVTNQETMT
jgi:hypothetical protein